AAAAGLCEFILKTGEEAECLAAITAVSQTGAPGVEAKLIEAYRQFSVDTVRMVANYQKRVRIMSVLGRVATTSATRAFLEEQSAGGFWEMIAGTNKDLREAAKASLETMIREAKAHGKTG